jgi:hypothetical protein
MTEKQKFIVEQRIKLFRDLGFECVPKNTDIHLVLWMEFLNNNNTFPRSWGMPLDYFINFSDEELLNLIQSFFNKQIDRTFRNYKRELKQNFEEFESHEKALLLTDIKGIINNIKEVNHD